MSLAKKLPLLVVPALVFCGATVATLAADGKLDSLPVVGHALEHHGGAESHEEKKSEGGEKTASPQEENHHEGGEARKDGEAPVGSSTGQAIAASFDLPRPFEAEELEALVSRLSTARDALEGRARAAEEERTALVLLAKDLDERRSEMERIMGEVERDRDALDAERAAHELKRANLADSEVDALRPVAKAYEEMSPEAAAERLARIDPESAVKILALIRPKKCAKILEATEPMRAADLSKRLGTLKRGAERPQGGP